MGLFSFLTENGRGSLAVLAKEKLTYEVRNKSSEKLVLLFNLCVVPQHFFVLIFKCMFLLA